MNNSQNFAVGQKVVYPSQGVGVIRAIEEKPFNGAQVAYYIIHIEASDMTIMAPVEKAGELGIRCTVGEDEAMEALTMIGEEFEPNPSDWKLRYQMNLDLLKKGSIHSIAKIVRSLYHRSKIKELPIMEKKLCDSAQNLFKEELSIALNKSKKEIEAMIHARLEAQEE
ncbi:MAG: CarD family transcriptional regulator [Treponema sp.]|nr:CarD family transcriptional regulator [Treponema sp.]